MYWAWPTVVSQTCQSYWWQTQAPPEHVSVPAGHCVPQACPLILQPVLAEGALQVSPLQHPAQFWLQ